MQTVRLHLRMKKIINLIRLKYSQSWIISLKGKQDNYFNSFLENLDRILKQYDFKTKANITNIEFQKTYRSTTNYGNNMTEAMKVIRTGKIELILKPNNILIIKSLVDLSYLTFMTLLVGLIILIIGLFLKFNYLTLGILIFSGITICIIIGMVIIVSKMDEIIEITKRKT